MTQLSSIFACTFLLLLAADFSLSIIPVVSDKLIDAPERPKEIIERKTNESKQNFFNRSKEYKDMIEIREVIDKVFNVTDHNDRLNLRTQGKEIEQQLREQVLPQINEQAKSINGRQYSLKELTEAWHLWRDMYVGDTHYNVTLKAYATAPDETVNMLVEYVVVVVPDAPCYLKSWRLID